MTRHRLLNATAASVFILSSLIIELCNGSGILSLKLIRYRNPGGKGNNGNCCDGSWIFCEINGCDHWFTLCADNYNGPDNVRNCAIGKVVTNTVHDSDNVNFGSSISGTPNPINFLFTTWPGSVKLKIEIWDDDTGSNAHDYVDFIHKNLNLIPERSAAEAIWQRYTISGRTSMVVDVKSYCDLHWYGMDCNTYCKPTNNSSGHYTCNQMTGQKTCNPGWSGTSCTVQIDECQSSPCHHGGTCRDALNGYTCACKPGYIGQRCEFDVNECVSNPCHNDSYCLDMENGYMCTCAPGYTGPTCHDDINECASNPCDNNATCVNGKNYFSCLCEAGWTGPTCSSDVDDCVNVTCPANSLCKDLHKGFSCDCMPGWTGAHCGVLVDACQSSPCSVNATCLDVGDGYNCTCPDGWEGDNCTERVMPCESNPCQGQGTCVAHGSVFECQCPHGRTGRVCETRVGCQNDTCLNGGVCTAHHTCQCAPGFTGTHCEHIPYLCSSQPCFNNATCLNTTHGYICVCPDDYSGDLCEIELNNTADPFPTADWRESAFWFSGKLSDEDAKTTVNIITDMIAEMYDTESDHVNIDYKTDTCDGEKHMVVTEFIFYATVNGERIKWDKIQEAFDTLPAEKFNGIFPAPLYKGEMCNNVRHSKQLANQSWAQANWFVIVAIMVGVVLLLVALGMAVYLARRRKRSQVPVGTANAVYDSSLDDSEDATTVRDRQPQVNGLTFENTLYAELHTEEIGKSHA